MLSYRPIRANRPICQNAFTENAVVLENRAEKRHLRVAAVWQKTIGASVRGIRGVDGPKGIRPNGKSLMADSF